MPDKPFPFDAVGFDADGTLSHIEGITQLAEYSGVEIEVRALTETAMSQTGMNPALYKKRLDLVKPNAKQLHQVGEAYVQHITPGVKEVIATLQAQDILVFVCSAGLMPCLKNLAHHVGIPEKHIYGVGITLDAKGEYVDFDHASPMVTQKGKATVIRNLKTQYPRIAFVGDGMNDAELKGEVDRFIGYGGAFYREPIKALADAYIEDTDMRALLPLLSC